MEKYEQALQYIEEYAKTVVGVLCKRVEVLEKENCLKPNLYKALIKENIYELFRNLKSQVEVILTVGLIEFKPKPKRDE